MLAGLQDAHGVHEPVAALLGHHEGQILVVLQHGQIVAGVVHGDGRVAALHLAEDLIHDEGLIHALVLGVLHQLERLIELSLVGGVDVVAQIAQGRHQRVAGVVDHQHLSGVLLVKHSTPAGDGLIHHLGVVDDAHSTPAVGHGVLVLRIEAQGLVLRINEVIVGDGAVIQLCQHPLVDKPPDHVIGGHDHVEIRAAGLEQGVQRLVALRRLIVDMDTGLGLKFADKRLVDILAPAAHVDNTLLLTSVAAAGQQSHGHHDRQHKRDDSFQCFILLK